ncbi:MAG: hypothetical protein ACYS8I_12010 [Planctomycetota bacterium]|jgi:hypothetical protein
MASYNEDVPYSPCEYNYTIVLQVNDDGLISMNNPAASNGVSIGIFIIAPRGGELNLYPPQEGLSAGGLI